MSILLKWFSAHAKNRMLVPAKTKHYPTSRRKVKLMNNDDRLQENDLKIIKVLYDQWKRTNFGQSFQAESSNVDLVLEEAGMSWEQACPVLNNLQDFDFIAWDGNDIKILPSGIKYSLGQFDHLQ